MTARRGMLRLIVAGVLLAAASLPVRSHENPVREPVTVTLTTSKNSYRLGEPVQMTITVCNRSSRTVTLHFHTYQLFDAVAYSGQTGREVWRWSADKVFAQALTTREVAPGCSWTIPLEWLQQDNSGRQVPPGFYYLRAEVTSHPAYGSNLWGIWITR